MSEFAQMLRDTLAGRNLQVARRETDWELSFSDGLLICVAGYWRLLDPTGVLVTDMDDGHQYGLPLPVDAQSRANAHLKGAVITEVDFDGSTGDLTIYAGQGLIFEVITFSVGYESWQMYSDNGFEAAVGNGGLR